MLHKTETYAAQNGKYNAAQNGKYMLHEMENIRCTKRNLCAAQNGIYVTRKRIYVTQKRIQITENGKWNTSIRMPIVVRQRLCLC